MQLYHTFISYSRADGEFALKLANDLRTNGVNIWLDQIDIPPGARWDRAVENALETAAVFWSFSLPLPPYRRMRDEIAWLTIKNPLCFSVEARAREH
jgi:hypothetical protein